MDGALDNLLLLIREPANSLDKTKVSAANECQFADVGRCGKMVKHHQLNIFLKNMLLKCGV